MLGRPRSFFGEDKQAFEHEIFRNLGRRGEVGHNFHRPSPGDQAFGQWLAADLAPQVFDGPADRVERARRQGVGVGQGEILLGKT